MHPYYSLEFTTHALCCAHMPHKSHILIRKKKTSRTEAAEWLHSAMKMWSIAGKEVNMKIDFDLLSCPNWDTKILLGLIHFTCSLHSRCNWTSVSNIREAAPRSFFWASTNSTNYWKCLSNFLSSWWQIHKGFFNKPIMVHTQILVPRWGLRTRISVQFCKQT